MSRSESALLVSRRLLIFTGISLLATSALFLVAFRFGRFPVTWFCFQCGIIGGFVSIQQRLDKVKDEELRHLAQSWATILIIPVFGGVFALVFYMLVLSGILQGALFPLFAIPPFPKDSLPSTQDFVRFFTETYPASGPDFAKLAFWAFVSGFSERFVPQIISKVSDQASGQGGQGGDGGEPG